jgi:flagellar protein FliS
MSAYQTQQVMTSSPVMLVAMLYDKAIQCLKEVIQAIEAGNVEARWKSNQRAYEIIQHLQLTLNLEKGGEIARNLDRLYSLMLRLLPQVNMANNAAPAREVIALLEPLRDAWRQGAKAGPQADATGANANTAEATRVSA